ncbi:winged helix-turn-helix transcriptional regulator [Rhizobium wuzhouense]|uniref:Transcriptional regulator n=1 Tax=Rhizobium wuzhouense TaxID=1986026 RepID=A0ABX5NV83_9HYPH|nr:helix-turn-helix domain-containing protein [Rhizobium wuzhouense]PYB76985.1 transcriptional regulator [Rhizobium wuzhouense]
MTSPPRSLCPIALALDLFGDAWSLLIVRDLMFKGICSFNGFLAAGEGIATNVLTDRLVKLEQAGIITKARDGQDRRRFVYRLTAKGAELAPVLVSMVLWSAKHTPTDAPRDMVAAMAANPQGFAMQVIRRVAADEAGPARG